MMTPAQTRLTKQLVTALQSKGTPKVPLAGGEIWRAFVALSRARSYGANGPNPISYLEIEAWCRLTGMPLQPHHIEMICAMDQAWLKSGSTQPKSNLTVAGFDAVFG